MPVSSSDTLVLYNRAYQMSAQQRLIQRLTVVFLVLVPVLLVAVIVTIFPNILDYSTEEWEKLSDRLWQDLKEDSTELISYMGFFVLALLQSGYVFLARRRERLILNSLGIRYQSPLPNALQALKPSWALQWSQVRGAYLKPSRIIPGPQLVTLVLDTGLYRRKVIPFQWVNLDDPPLGPHDPRKWRSLKGEQIRSLLQLSPIMQYLTNAGIDVKTDLVGTARFMPFALERNPHSLVAVILFFALVAYALTDAVFINQEIYAERPFYEAYLMAGLLIAAVATAWLRRANVPVIESILVAVLLGGAFGAALYPGLLRLNEFSDKHGLRAYKYVLQNNLSLEPENEKLPILRFERDLNYWSHFSTGSVHEIELRRGGLEFYQINMAPIYADMKQYYRERRDRFSSNK